jgi:hypothetical protein
MRTARLELNETLEIGIRSRRTGKAVGAALDPPHVQTGSFCAFCVPDSYRTQDIRAIFSLIAIS